MIIIKGILKPVKRLKTGVKVIFFAKELSETDLLSLKNMEGLEGHLAFSEDRVKKEVEDAMKDLKVGMDERGKSKSQIVRGLVMRYWTDYYKGSLNFGEYYNKTMNIIIDKLRQKINDKEFDRMIKDEKGFERNTDTETI